MDEITVFLEKFKRVKTTKKILIPSGSMPIREVGLLDVAFQLSGYQAELLPHHNTTALETGLKYVNNEYCHPPVDYVGQIVQALQSGKYPLDDVAVMLMDPGPTCSCRGANFFSVLRKAMDDSGYENVPLIGQPMDFKEYLHNPHAANLELNLELIKRLVLVRSYADLFEKVVFRTRPYETYPGEVAQRQQRWLKVAAKNLENMDLDEFQTNMLAIIEEFDTMALLPLEKPVVGIVGDYGLPIRYSQTAHDVAQLLEEEGAEVVIPGFGFMSTYHLQDMGGPMEEYSRAIYEKVEQPLDQALRESKRFRGFYSIFEMKKEADRLAPFANYEGNFMFLMGGKMIELLKDGVDDLVLYQAFNCSINYVVGVGMNKKIKYLYPSANIVNIDYDPGMSTVNAVNRIRLFLNIAEKRKKTEVNVGGF